jgi:hypothetical protein
MPKSAVRRLEAIGHERSTAIRCVGYAALARFVGWSELREMFTDPESFEMLLETFREAGIDPVTVNFSGSTQPYLEEVVNSGEHPVARRAARAAIARTVDR